MENEKKKIVYGHQKMKVWQNVDCLDEQVQLLLEKIPRFEYKIRSQIDSASDSVGANFVEGYYSGSVSEYIRFCRYGKRSLGELQERVRRALRKGYFSETELMGFNDLSIKTMFMFDRLIRALEIKRASDEEKAKKRI